MCTKATRCSCMYDVSMPSEEALWGRDYVPVISQTNDFDILHNQMEVQEGEMGWNGRGRCE